MHLGVKKSVFENPPCQGPSWILSDSRKHCFRKFDIRLQSMDWILNLLHLNASSLSKIPIQMHPLATAWDFRIVAFVYSLFTLYNLFDLYVVFSFWFSNGTFPWLEPTQRNRTLFIGENCLIWSMSGVKGFFNNCMFWHVFLHWMTGGGEGPKLFMWEGDITIHQ